MIIKNTESRVRVIPFKNNMGAGKVILLPGNNDVNNDDWLLCRENLTIKQHIKSKSIVEVHAEVKVKKAVKEDKAKKVKAQDEVITLTAKEFGNLSIVEAEEVVKDTYNLKTLKKWKKKCTKDVTAAVIREQIEYVEKHGTKEKPKED